MYLSSSAALMIDSRSKTSFVSLRISGQQRRIDVEQVQDQEGLVVHLVRGVEVRVELVDLAVRQHSDACFGHREVPEELRRVLDAQRLRRLLALHEHLDLALAHDGVVDLLTALHTDVGRELGDDLERVEDVVAQDRGDEGHDKGVLRRLFRLNGRPLVAHLLRERSDGLVEIHGILLDRSWTDLRPIARRSVRLTRSSPQPPWNRQATASTSRRRWEMTVDTPSPRIVTP